MSMKMENEGETEELINRGKPHFELMLTGDGSRSPPRSPIMSARPRGSCGRLWTRMRSALDTCVPALLLLAVLALILFMIIAGRVIEE